MSYTASTSPDGLTLRCTSTEGATLSVPTTALWALPEHSAWDGDSPLATWPLGAILALAEHVGEKHPLFHHDDPKNLLMVPIVLWVLWLLLD